MMPIGSGASSSMAAQGLRNLTKKGFHVGYGGVASSAAPSVSYSTSTSTWMDVSLNLDGFYVRHADIDLRLHKHAKNIVTRKAGFVTTGSHHHFHTKLDNPKSPWVLDQVKAVYARAKEQMAKLQAFLAHGANDSTERRSLDAQHCMHDLIVALVESRNIMTNPSSNTFPQVLRPAEARGGCEFSPCPPSELLVEFSVHLGELIASAYEVHHLSSPKEASVLTDSWVNTSNYTNKVFRFGNQTVQVVDQVQVHFKVHSLQWVMDNMYDAYNAAVRMLRKIECFNRHEMGLKLQAGADASAQAIQTAEEIKAFTDLPHLVFSNA